MMMNAGRVCCRIPTNRGTVQGIECRIEWEKESKCVYGVGWGDRGRARECVIRGHCLWQREL